MVYFYDRLLPFLAGGPLMSAAHNEHLEFHKPPVGQDSSYVLCIVEALCLMGRMEGLSSPHARAVTLFVRTSVLAAVHNDIHVVTSIAPGEVDLLRVCVQTISLEASENSKDGDSLIGITFMTNMKALVDSVVARLDVLDKTASTQPLYCNMTNKTHIMPDTCQWSWFGRFCRDTDVEKLAGEAPVPPILRPVELSKVPDKVSNFHELCCAMRHTLDLCVLLANQKSLIRNSYSIRVCLIEHLFVRVIPLPLPINDPKRDELCFWHAQSIRNETQFDILKLLNLLGRHFATASLSVKYTRSGDAIRILTISCMAAVCDAALRKIATDIPSQASLHYSGRAMGPILPFGFDMGKFAVESEYLQFNTPETVAARTQVLDYFAQIRKVISPDHLMFRFDRTSKPSAGELTFVNQICVQLGFPTNLREVYLVGEDTELLDNYPEIGYFRDLIFLLKLVMIPSSDGLPEVKMWNPKDAALVWTFHNGEYVVHGFNRRLSCEYPDVEEDDGKFGQAPAKGGIFSRLWRYMGLTKTPRASPSRANPSVLAGERVDTEDDVLHIRNLPNFDMTMSASDSELLLQYLTAPYLRIPLLLSFFSNEKRLKCLRVEELQEVVDAALFEPGRWQEEHIKEPPSTVPAPDRNHLSTSVGLLFNEIIMAPDIILKSILTMLEKSADMDTGKYSDISESVLYVLRLAVRIEGYMLFLEKNYDYHNSIEEHKNGDKLSGAYEYAYVRGLQCSSQTIELVRSCQKSLRSMIDTKMFGIIARWIVRAKTEGKMVLACKLHAHLSYINKNIDVNQLNPKTVFTQLAGQIFLSNNFKYDLDFVESDITNESFFSRKSPEVIKCDLGIPQVELFDMYQRNRLRILNWLLANPVQRNEVSFFQLLINCMCRVMPFHAV